MICPDIQVAQYWKKRKKKKRESREEEINMAYPVSSSFPDIQQRTMEEEEACVVVMVMSC